MVRLPIAFTCILTLISVAAPLSAEACARCVEKGLECIRPPSDQRKKACESCRIHKKTCTLPKAPLALRPKTKRRKIIHSPPPESRHISLLGFLLLLFLSTPVRGRNSISLIPHHPLFTSPQTRSLFAHFHSHSNPPRPIVSPSLFSSVY